MTHFRRNDTPLNLAFWWPLVTSILTYVKKWLKYIRMYSLRAIGGLLPRLFIPVTFWVRCGHLTPPPHTHTEQRVKPATRARVNESTFSLKTVIGCTSVYLLWLHSSVTWTGLVNLSLTVLQWILYNIWQISVWFDQLFSRRVRNTNMGNWILCVWMMFISFYWNISCLRLQL